MPRSAVFRRPIRPPARKKFGRFPKPPAAPATPNAPAVDQTNADGIQVRWNTQGYVANSTSYTIERSPDGTTGWTTVATGVTRSDATWRDWGLNPLTTYWYRLTAVGPGGSSSPSATGNGTTAAVSTVANNFDGQTNGTTWTPANSDDTSGDLLTQSLVGTVPTTYDTGTSISGGSLKTAVPSTAPWNSFIYPGSGTWEQGRSSYFRGYVRSDLTTAGTPAVNIMQFSGQQQFYIRWAPATGTVYVVDGSGVTKTTFAGTYDMATAFIRVEVYAHYDGMVASWDVRLFVGANLHGTTPDEQINWTYNDSTTSVATTSVGPGGYSNGTACNVWWDEIKWSDDTWVGPASIVTAQFAAFGIPL